jgi:hypothetical protein
MVVPPAPTKTLSKYLISYQNLLNPLINKDFLIIYQRFN